jgi:bacterial leucyl aminopeptidase
MKFSITIALSAAASQTALAAALTPEQQALFHPYPLPNTEKYLVELGLYRSRWVTEEEKWALKLVLPVYAMWRIQPPIICICPCLFS